MQQQQAINGDELGVCRRNHAVVIREFAIDHFTGQLDIAKAEAHLVGQNVNRNRLIGISQQLGQLDHRFARHDDFLLREIAFNGHHGIAQAMTIGGHAHQLIFLKHKQHAVQIKADVLLCHRELDKTQCGFEQFLRQRKALQLLLTHGQTRIVGRRQGLKAETAFAGLYSHLAVFGVDGDLAGIRQRAQQVLELSGGHGDGLVARVRHFNFRRNLQFKIGRDGGEGVALVLEQHVGQDRQRLPPLDDAGDCLQWFQHQIARYVLKLHINLILFNNVQ